MSNPRLVVYGFETQQLFSIHFLGSAFGAKPDIIVTLLRKILESLVIHSARNFFKTFYDSKMVNNGIRSYGSFLGSFEGQCDGQHGKL